MIEWFLEKYSWWWCDTWIIWGEQKKVLNLHNKRTTGLSWTFCLELGDHHFIILSLCYFRGWTWDVKIYWKKSKHNPMTCQSQVQVGQGASPKMNGKNGSETKEPKDSTHLQSKALFCLGRWICLMPYYYTDIRGWYKDKPWKLGYPR